MVDGQSGVLGVAVVRLAEADHRRARAVATILHRQVVVPIVKEIVPSPFPATRMTVQVCSQFL